MLRKYADAGQLLVDQNGETERQEYLNRVHQQAEDDGDLERLPEDGVIEDAIVVGEAGKNAFAAAQ